MHRLESRQVVFKYVPYAERLHQQSGPQLIRNRCSLRLRHTRNQAPVLPLPPRTGNRGIFSVGEGLYPSISGLNLLVNQHCLQCYRHPVAILLHVHSREAIITTVILPVLGSFLNRATGHNRGVSLYAHFQIRDFPRFVMERSRPWMQHPPDSVPVRGSTVQRESI